MKKVFSLFATAALAFAFTACEDIPAPYEIYYEEEEIPGAEGVIVDESFATDLGSFSAVNTVGNYSWYVNYSCAQVTSYTDDDGDGTKENNQAESWMVSSPLDLTEVDSAYVNFDYILRYATNSQISTHYQLLVSKDYNGSDVASATWTALPLSLVQGSDWDTWYSSGDIQIPSEFCNTPNVYVALFYKATTKAATWEVKNFKVLKGAANASSGDDSGSDAVKVLPYSEEFSTSFGSFKNVTTSGAGEWIIDYSTAKATGYDNASKVTTAGTYYLVSPQISLSDVTEAYVSYEYILRYNRGDENQKVLISADYTDNPAAATWTTLAQKHTEGADWVTFETGKVNIPAEFMGKTVRVAFYYNTNATSGSTWEVKNFSIQQGKVEGGQTPDTPDAGGTKTLPYTESFTSSLGAFTSITATGGGEWINDFKTAKASNYDSATKETTPGTIYLVSPAISLEGVKTAYLAYESIVNYNKGDANQQVLISKDYAGDPSTATWTLINQTHAAFVDWNTFESLSFAVPADFIGSTVYVAFRYNAEASGCSTWEVRNFSMTETADEGGSEEGGSTTEIGGLETFANGGFEEWTGNKPTHWTPTTTAGNGTLSQSTDAHSGNYSVKVTGATSGNKRIGYKEMILEPGKYTMQFYTKAATAAGGSVRPGYVPVTDGKVGQYVYGEYTNDLINTEWVLVTHQFELSAKTTVNLVIMNAKNPGKDVLIDDFTITKE